MAHSFDAITNPPPDLGGGLRHLLILTLSPSERIRLDYPSLYKSGRDQKDESDIRKQAILLWTPGNSVLPMKGKSSIPGTFFSYHIIPLCSLLFAACVQRRPVCLVYFILFHRCTMTFNV